jgi:dienelactone hydrolase
MIARSLCLALLLFAIVSAFATDYRSIPTEPTEGDRMLNKYFERETRRLTARNASFIENTSDWPAAQSNLRRQLFEMLGLQPLPARSDLKAEITSSVEREGVIVENLTFQSSPELYVTANFYRPAKQDGPLPTILYVCGHGGVKIDGVSYGNKTTYQHHGTWFAKNGYTCLTIDTLQLGEIEGKHHGTHNLGRWWWNSRGYTPAGVEAWNSIRALDYLETRPEVDKEKFGVTGRSGGGAYTLWIAALDERIKVAAPVAGITSMQNHVVDGCIEGHCDCMYMVNTFRWDFPLVTALIAPRPLMILNTDKDNIFPVDGVVDVYQKTRKVYEAMGATDKIGLAFYEGPHKDTQPLRVPAFHWFERHFKGIEIGDEIADTRAPKIFEPAELKVFGTLPENERNTFIDEDLDRKSVV